MEKKGRGSKTWDWEVWDMCTFYFFFSQYEFEPYLKQFKLDKVIDSKVQLPNQRFLW